MGGYPSRFRGLPFVRPRVRRERGAIGSEFRVNAYTTGPHFAPRVSTRAGGDLVVVWGQGQAYDYYYRDGPRCGSDAGDCQDGSGYGIIGRPFDTDAVARSDDVAATGRHDQLDGDVALNANGRFVVVWRDADRLRAESHYCRYSMGADGSGDSIEIRSGSLTMNPPWSRRR